MIKVDRAIDIANLGPRVDPTLQDIRAKADALRSLLTEDAFEAAAFKASPKAVLSEHDNVLADMRKVPLCADCTTTCGITNICRRTSR